MHSTRSVVSRRIGYTLGGRTVYTRWSSTVASDAVASEVQSARSYCIDLLKYVSTFHTYNIADWTRRYDAPSYTLLAFVPPPAQTAYLAIRAFNIEIARIPDTVSTPHVGAMRMQFWKDNVTKSLQGSPPKHPVPILLSAAVDSLDVRTSGAVRFSKSWLMRLITAREKYLQNNPYPDLSALESYAESTQSTLLYLTLQSLPMASVAADHLASHIGKAAGITASLRGLPSPPNHHSNNMGLAGSVADQRTRSQQGFVNLPLDVMVKAGVREEDVLRRGAEATGLKDAVFDVATRASDHLITARTMLQNLSRGEDVDHDFEHGQEDEHAHTETGQSSPVNQQLADIERAFGMFMPAVSTQLWLDKLQKVDFDVFSTELRKREWKLPWKAYFSNRQRMF
jgi:NADH dehydrogenase [ubiquinone] 1 alpha subcomplex assembly factor 6